MADSKVKDMGLAEFGRKELTLAEYEMPCLMAARKEGAALGAKLRCAPETSSAPRTTLQQPSPRLAHPLLLLGRVRHWLNTGGARSK